MLIVSDKRVKEEKVQINDGQGRCTHGELAAIFHCAHLQGPRRRRATFFVQTPEGAVAICC